jgi:pimeloyl-ACP methyl ester carboxylesterase
MNKVADFAKRASRLGFSVIMGALALASAPQAARADLIPDLLGGGDLPSVTPVPGSSRPNCQSYKISVSLTPLSLVRHNVAIEICMPADNARDTVLLTVPGATYSRAYWDFPYDPDHYSFVQAGNAAGYATCNIDRIGTGESDHPLSALTTLDRQAYIGYQIILALRSGLMGHAFQRVVLVGHSLGSVIAIGLAATYKIVDGLIVTGYLHTFGLGLPAAVPNVWPAMIDPKFTSSSLDPGYVTTQPGTRGSTFYYMPSSDPAVLAFDELLKETVTAVELAELAAYGSVAMSNLVDVPVLSVVGRYDSLFCLAVPCTDVLNAATLEPLAYCPEAELELQMISEAGHDLNLQTNAPLTFAAILDWLHRRFPPPGE